MKSVYRPILLSFIALSTGCELDGEPVAGMPEVQSVTADYEQAEAVVAVKDMGSGNQNIIIAYNDLTQDPNNPKIEYPLGPSGNQRIIHPGASLMGWSVSVDNGLSYIYGGRLSPPPDWSLLWSDPAITAGPTIITDAAELKLVYWAQLAASVVKFPYNETIVTPTSPDVLDGFCVAMSTNGGLTFPSMRCFKQGICGGSTSSCEKNDDCPQCNGDFYDGTALAHLNDTIYFSAFNFVKKTIEVWRANAGTLNFSRMSNPPFGSSTMIVHPRLRVFNGRLYVLGQRKDGFPMMTFLEDGSDEWHPPIIVGNQAAVLPVVLLSDRKVRGGPQYSFDVAFGNDGVPETRVLYTRVAESGKFFLEATQCNADLLPSAADPAVAKCRVLWNTSNSAGDQFNPLLKVAGGGFVGDTIAVWQGVWLSRRDDPSGNVLSLNRGKLQILANGAPLLVSLDLIEPQVPCSTTGGYWGDYNDLGVLVHNTSPGGPQFVTPFTDNRSSVDPTPCAFRGLPTADMHVSAVVFQ